MRLDGCKDGKRAGIVIFNHPDCVNYPAHWMARGWGLFAVNPFGQYIFENGRHEKVKDAKRFDYTLQPGESVVLRFGMIVFDGPKTIKNIEERFKEYISN